MILYIIQAHRNLEQVLGLVAQIGKQSVCLVNLDPRLRPELVELGNEVSSRGFKNVYLRVGSPISWGGISQVYALLDALAYGLTLPERWEFSINLSGDSVVLAPQAEIANYYRDALKAGRRVHLSFFGPGTQVSEFLRLPWAELEGFAIDYVPTNLYGRVPAMVDSQIQAMFSNRTTSPLFRWARRGSIHVSDISGEQKLIFRRLFQHEAELRATRFGGQQLFGGRVWCTLARSSVEALLSDPFLWEIVDRLSHFFCPDELFLQTYFSHSDRFKRDEVCRSNQRFKGGDIVKIHDGMVDELFASSKFFARKFDFRRCPNLYRRALAVCGS